MPVPRIEVPPCAKPNKIAAVGSVSRDPSDAADVHTSTACFAATVRVCLHREVTWCIPSFFFSKLAWNSGCGLGREMLTTS